MPKTTFEWETINNALTRKGYSTSNISNILIMLTNEVKREENQKRYDRAEKPATQYNPAKEGMKAAKIK